MSSRSREQWMLMTASLVVLAAIAIAFILWFTRSVMIPFILAVFVVAVVAPLADLLEQRLRFRRWMSVLAVLLIVLLVTAACLLLLTYTVGEVARTVSSYAVRAYDFAAGMIDAEPSGAEFAASLGKPEDAAPHNGARPDLDPPVPAPAAPEAPSPPAPAAGHGDHQPRLDWQWARQQIEPLLKNSISWGIAFTRRGVGSAIGLVSTFFLMVIFVMFLLTARGPRDQQHPTYREIEAKIRSYIATKTALSTVTGVLVGGILTAFGLQLAVVFGVLTFLLNFIPAVGSIIATLLPLPIAYGQFVADAAEPSWYLVAGVVVVPGAIQLAIGNILEPRIMGEGLELHPIAVLFALAFWGLLWGWVGAILAVPITAVVRIAIGRFESFRMVTDLMAGKLPGEPEAPGPA